MRNPIKISYLLKTDILPDDGDVVLVKYVSDDDTTGNQVVDYAVIPFIVANWGEIAAMVGGKVLGWRWFEDESEVVMEAHG